MIANKTALVTGSTSGIGLGMAKALARQGANIVLNGFGDVEAAQREVAALGVRVSYHGADMSKPTEIEAMMAAAAAEFGQVDILVNNAGIQHVAPIQNFPVERWDAVIAIHLTRSFHTTRPALPWALAQNHGNAPHSGDLTPNLAASTRLRSTCSSETYRGRIVKGTRLYVIPAMTANVVPRTW